MNKFLLYCLQDKIFGEAGSTVVIEEKLEGEEVSVSFHWIFWGGDINLPVCTFIYWKLVQLALLI